MTVDQSVLQLEGDVREGLEGCLPLTESLQLAGDGERVGEVVLAATEVGPPSEIVVERAELQDVGQLEEVVEVLLLERDCAGVEIPQEGLQPRHRDDLPALQDGLEAAGGCALLVLLKAVLEVEAEEGGVVDQLSEDPGAQRHLAGSPLARPGSPLSLLLAVEALPVSPQGGARGQEGLQPGMRNINGVVHQDSHT